MLNENTLILLAFILLILSLIAQFLVWLLFNIFKNVKAKSNISPMDFANTIIQNEGFPSSVEIISGSLSDHYDPSTQIVRLSQTTANNTGLSSLGITAHEFGHALQHRNSTLIFQARNAIASVAGFTSNAGYLLFFLGLVLSFTGLAWVGVILFSTSFLFYLITFPVELDASYKGLRLLKQYKVINNTEILPIILVLTAAASTYLLALLQSLVQLLRFIVILQKRR